MLSATLVILLTPQWCVVGRSGCRSHEASHGSTPMTRLDLFGGFLSFFLVAPFLVPLAPRLAKRPRGAWLVCCAVVAVLLLLFPAMFWWGCGWMDCGQGALALF